MRLSTIYQQEEVEDKCGMLRKNTEALTVLPPLESLVSSENGEFGNVQFLFDFAIAGFAKCGTSSVMKWLMNHPEVRMQGNEMEWFLDDPNRAIKTQYDVLVKEGKGVTGYKSPHHIQRLPYVDFFRNVIPKTKLILTLRHPVTWFQSFYSYRILVGKHVKGERRLNGVYCSCSLTNTISFVVDSFRWKSVSGNQRTSQ